MSLSEVDIIRESLAKEKGYSHFLHASYAGHYSEITNLAISKVYPVVYSENLNKQHLLFMIENSFDKEEIIDFIAKNDC